MADTQDRAERNAISCGGEPVMQTRVGRPPRLFVPDHVLGSPLLASFMAGLAVEHGPIFSFVPKIGPLAGCEIVYLVGPEANRFVLATHQECFSHDLGWTPVFGKWLGKGLANMDPPEHLRHRALMNPAFTGAFIDQCVPLMVRVIAERTRDWSQRGEVDLTEEVREISFNVASQALLGLHTQEDVDFLRERFYKLFHQPAVTTHEDGEAAARQERIREELNSRLLGLISSRRKSRADQTPCNVLDRLVSSRDEQGFSLSDEQLLAHVNILLVAGHETTTNLGAWLLYLLAMHPQYGNRVDQELAGVGAPDSPITSEAVRNLPVLTNAIRETGRLQPPVMFLPRGVLAEFEFGGCAVEVGTPVFLAIAAGHRLSTVFANPEDFDPDRFVPPREEDKRHPYALATFGGGQRTCLGANFAHLEVKVIAAYVRRRFRLTPIPGLDIPQTNGVLQCLPGGVQVWVDAVA